MHRDAQLDEIITIMARVHGRDLSRYDPLFLRKTLQARLSALGLEGLEGLARRLAGDPQEARELMRALGITYSEFFRDQLTFALLEQVVLPHLLEEAASLGRSEVRAWSAGCAGGQEAFSLAILLDEACAAQVPPAAFRVFATDICPDSLGQGRQALYHPQALQNVRLKHLQAYFQPQGQAYQVIERLRGRVDFSEHDLLDRRLASPPASIYGDFDLVLCSNLLFYYQPAARDQILDKVTACLRPGGYLVSGQAERGLLESVSGLRPLAAVSSVFRKTPARE